VDHTSHFSALFFNIPIPSPKTQKEKRKRGAYTPQCKPGLQLAIHCPKRCHLDFGPYNKGIQEEHSQRKIHVKKTSTKINVEKMHMITATCTSVFAGGIEKASL